MSNGLVNRLRKSSPSWVDATDVLLEAADTIESLQAHLPDGMEDCTIIFKECEKGHGWLTAANWVQHDCAQCKIESLQAQASEKDRLLEMALGALKTYGVRSHHYCEDAW
jgi:hypothetical protein